MRTILYTSIKSPLKIHNKSLLRMHAANPGSFKYPGCQLVLFRTLKISCFPPPHTSISPHPTIPSMHISLLPPNGPNLRQETVIIALRTEQREREREREGEAEREERETEREGERGERRGDWNGAILLSARPLPDASVSRSGLPERQGRIQGRMELDASQAGFKFTLSRVLFGVSCSTFLKIT